MPEHPNDKYMRRAIELSEIAGIKEKTGGVFGAVIVKDNNIIAQGYNQVLKHNDPTWHGEIQAIREACKKLKSPHLKGCVLYTSSAPCPMCMAAAYWAHVEHVYYAARIEDAAKYGGFADAAIYTELVKAPQERNIKCTEMAHLREEAIKIWQAYSIMPDRHHY
jgi:tRNA(Arg) A34 adenosine deaminase TadA